jgi:hypothetical protein
MADTVFQSDFKIKSPSDYGEKATLALDARGDLILVSGSEKLSEQLIRAVVTDDSIIRGAINSPVSIRNLKILFTIVIRNFRQNQFNNVNGADPSFSGFSFYRLASDSTSTYRKVSTDFITYQFSDVGLTNGVTYRYALAKVYNGVFESDFLERLSVVPQSISSKQEIVFGNEVVAMPGNGRIDFYVVYNPKYKGSELIEDLLSLDVKQDTNDPRMCRVNVVVQDARGLQVSVAAARQNPSA